MPRTAICLLTGMLLFCRPIGAAAPDYDGSAVVPGLAAAVEIARDEQGVASIEGECMLDVMRGLGYVHAQDRFFQMDGARRLAAGEISEIVGPLTLDIDRQYRPYRFRRVAEQVHEQLPAAKRRALAAYAEGVNAALDHISEPGLEYALFNVEPSPWKPEDSVLVALMMFELLNLDARFESRLAVMRDALPDELFAFLTPRQSRFDALLMRAPGEPVQGQQPRQDWSAMAIPDQDVINLRERAPLSRSEAAAIMRALPASAGSNNWAVAGSRTSDGRAILANDPHLPHSVPPIWFRAEMRWPDRELIGLTLPGVPGLVIGTNGHVAWGFTNSQFDAQDFIIIETDPDDEGRYRSPDGWEPFETVTERINVRGRAPVTLELRKTRWGTVTHRDHAGRPMVLKWTAREPEMLNLRILNMADAETVEEAVDVARSWYGPSQNVLVADRDGRIAWVVSGFLPKRVGFDGMRPVSWADPGVGWDGPLDEKYRPVIIDPPSGILYTANNRTVSADHAARLGNVWTGGERARRIAQLLTDGDEYTERDLFAMQLDTRVEFFDFYRDLALDAVGNDHDGLSEPEADLVDRGRAVIEAWSGRADADEPGTRLLNMYRRVLRRMVLAPLLAPARELDESFTYWWFIDEEPLRRILEERPDHLLPRPHETWDDLIAAAWLETLRAAELERGKTIETPWGEANLARIRHPLAHALPLLARRLGMPEHPQPGHSLAVRVATPVFGASARMVVSPGREDEAILHMPAGPTGHRSSRYFGAGHEAWAEGRPTPLLAGPAQARLVLHPPDRENGDP